jgi:hypothetical protein
MRGFRVASAAAVALFLLLAAGAAACGPAQPTTATSSAATPSTTVGGAVINPTTVPADGTSTSDETSSSTNSTLSTTSTLVSSTTSETVAQQRQFEDFAGAVFSNPSKIDNKWYSMQPGTQLVYEGFTEDENGDRTAHQIVLTITDLTKVVNGVKCAVVWDKDLADGQMEENELTFFAQDDAGNVWEMGEYPEEYEDGHFVEAVPWISGVQDARAGIMMKADPKAGQPSYSEGWGPSVNWGDRGQVIQTGVSTTVPVGNFDNVIVIKEFSEDEPGAFQLKYYAAGVGVIRVGWGGSDDTKETLELTKIVHLDAAGLADARTQALALEKHAYEVSKDVYGKTPPAQPAAAN